MICHAERVFLNTKRNLLFCLLFVVCCSSCVSGFEGWRGVERRGVRWNLSSKQRYNMVCVEHVANMRVGTTSVPDQYSSCCS